MNSWSIYYVSQRKDKLYAWNVSLSHDSYKQKCWQEYILLICFSNDWTETTVQVFKVFITPKIGSSKEWIEHLHSIC